MHICMCVCVYKVGLNSLSQKCKIHHETFFFFLCVCMYNAIGFAPLQLRQKSNKPFVETDTERERKKEIEIEC